MPDWRVGAARDLPVNLEQAFDAGPAGDRIFEWAGWDGARPPDHDGGDARRGFLVYDAEHPDVRWGYGIPFTDVVDGALYAFADGIDDAESQLEDFDDLTVDTRNEARKVLDVYRTRIDAEGGSMGNDNPGSSAGMGTTPADEESNRSAPLIAVVPLDRAMRGMIAPGSQDLPERLLAQIPDRSVLQETALYVLRSVVSNDREDFYGTRMRPSSLKNYRDDAVDGAPFCNSHNTDILPFGRSFDGIYKANRGTTAQTLVDTYVPVDLNVNGTDTTQLVRGIRTGVVRDISIGFDPGAILCSIDNKRFPLTFDELFQAFESEEMAAQYCLRHFPGVDYVEDGKKVHCTGEVEDARMIEHSPVYRGATPGAAIIDVGSRAVKASTPTAQLGLLSPGIRYATWMAEAGKLDRYAADFLEHHTRGLSFPSTTTRRHAGYRPRPARRAAAGDTAQDANERALPSTTRTEEPMHPEQRNTAPDSRHTEDPPPGVELPDDDDGELEPTEGAAGTEVVEDPTPATAAPSVQESQQDRGMAPAGMRAVLIQHGAVPDGWEGNVLDQVAEMCRELNTARTELVDLRPWADVGRRAREVLSQRCRRIGVQAFGNDFPEALYGPMLQGGTERSASYEELLELEQFFLAQRKRRYGEAGRQTQDVPDGTVDASGSHSRVSANGREPAAPGGRGPDRPSRAAFRSR